MGKGVGHGHVSAQGTAAEHTCGHPSPLRGRKLALRQGPWPLRVLGTTCQNMSLTAGPVTITSQTGNKGLAIEGPQKSSHPQDGTLWHSHNKQMKGMLVPLAPRPGSWWVNSARPLEAFLRVNSRARAEPSSREPRAHLAAAGWEANVPRSSPALGAAWP